MVLEWGAQSLTPRTRLQQEQRRRAPVPGPGQGLVQGLGGRRTGALLFAQLALNLLLFAGWWHSFYSVQPGSERQEQELEQRGEDRLMSVEISMARPRPQFLLFGDSITQQSFRPGGWGAALADRYSRKADVVLRGYSGYNTRWAMYLLHRIFPPKSEVTPSLVTVFFGANDAALPDRGSQHQHVPLSEYKENLHRIVAHLKGISDSVLIVLITPPPVDEEGRLAHARVMYGDNAVEIPERTNEFAGLYARACQAVARDENVPVIDLWSAIQAKHNWQEFYLSDGLHLTAAGNSVVFEELVKVLDNPTKGASLGADSLPMDYPEHSHVDPTDPAKTFSDL